MEHPRYADAARATRHMFIRDLVLVASIGVHAHEHDSPQRVRINVDLAVTEEDQRLSRPAVGQDELGRVVDYEGIVHRVHSIVSAGHVQLVETLAERLCEACLADPRVHTARVRVEKLDIFPDAAAAGVEVERRNRQLSTP